MTQPAWLHDLYPLEDGWLKHLRAVWVSFNLSQDKMDTLMVVDAYAEYLSIFINPEMARNVSNSQKFGQAPMVISHKNEDFDKRMSDAKAGKVRAPKVREDLARKAQEVDAMLRKSKVREVNTPEGA